MNTKSLLTRIAVPVLSLGLLGGLGAALATSADAGTLPAATMASVSKTVTAVTYSPNHYDTTSVPTGVNSPNGPLWAYDNLIERFTAVPEGAGQWSVTINVAGTFDGFANPVTGLPQVNKGTVRGVIQYDVTSPNKPSKALLPKVEPKYTGLGTAMSQLFGGSETVTGGGHYLFTYTKVAGKVYTQAG
jgi:hypothetical protein